jgi:hypothetical protein
MCFGSRTAIDNRTVFIDRQELVSVLSQEALFDGTENRDRSPGRVLPDCPWARCPGASLPIEWPQLPGALDRVVLWNPGTHEY